MKSGKHNLIKKLQFSRLQNSNLYGGYVYEKKYSYINNYNSINI